MIGYIVACFKHNNTGKGGHYYTALSIFLEIQSHRKSCMVVIGDHKPSAIDFTHPGIYFIRVSRWIKHQDITKLLHFAQKTHITILHSFDTYAFLFCRLVGSSSGIRVVSTKCGGPNPILHYYPGICPDTVFSPEDQAYFSHRASMFKVTPPVLIPNRVREPNKNVLSPEFKKLPIPSNPKSIKITRIARICRAYEQSIFQTIALTEALRSRGLKVTLYIIGYIQDENVYKRVQKAIRPSDFLLTHEEYTRCASRHLEDVDVVVASGRGVMEASVSGKIILCSAKNAVHPYLLDVASFPNFFQYNFSSRAAKPDISENRNLGNLVKLLSDKNEIARYRCNMEKINDRYFKISKAIPAYQELYDNCRADRQSLLYLVDLWIHRIVSVVKLGLRKFQYAKGRDKRNG
jgi:hypothetical protein